MECVFPPKKKKKIDFNSHSHYVVGDNDSLIYESDGV